MNDIVHTKSIAEACQSLGLPKPKHPLITVFYDREVNYDSLQAGQRLSSDLYMIAYKDKVTGAMDYGRNSYDFCDGTLIFVAPNQVVTVMEDNEMLKNSDGWILLFHPDLIRKSALGQNIEEYSFFTYDISEALHLSQEERKHIEEVVDRIKKEYAQNIDKHSQRLIVSNLELLLNYCIRFFDRQFYTRTNFNEDFVTRFEGLLRTYFQSDKPLSAGLPSVKYFGESLHMSPNYLSDLLKKETGKSAKSHINLYIINKAKTQILSTSLPISQIAYGLGFEYPESFSKLFKAKTGMSPSAYRNQN